MERWAEDESIGIAESGDDDWIRYLEKHGVVRTIGGPTDPCKVVEPSASLWGRAVSGRALLRPAASPRAESTGVDAERHASSAQVPGPSEFLEEFRRQRSSERSALVKVGNWTVPSGVAILAAQIDASRAGIEQANYADEDGLPTDVRTWERAAEFALKAIVQYWFVRQTTPPVPMFSADLDGGVDIVWRHRNRSLYMNIPAGQDHVVTFSGRDRSNPSDQFSGEVGAETNGEWLLGWFAK